MALLIQAVDSKYENTDLLNKGNKKFSLFSINRINTLFYLLNNLF